MGVTTQGEKGDAEAIPFFKRAIEIDPNFAMAYARVGISYANLGQPSQARREVLKSLEEAPRFLEAHRLLLELVGPDKPPASPPPTTPPGP